MLMLESTIERATRLLTNRDEFERRARFEYCWSFWPRRCYRSQRWIWGQAVRAEAIWTGPGEPIIEQRWLHRDEGLMLVMKRTKI